ncbi:hypothetical protein TNCV_3128061 [Trichonephila clavipes]|nr:hypothetical protein TNCV_3128061 [Trichonephila clavipes]
MHCFPFETGIHCRRKTDFFPEENTTISYTGFEHEPTRFISEWDPVKLDACSISDVWVGYIPASIIGKHFKWLLVILARAVWESGREGRSIMLNKDLRAKEKDRLLPLDFPKDY